MIPSSSCYQCWLQNIVWTINHVVFLDKDDYSCLFCSEETWVKSVHVPSPVSLGATLKLKGSVSGIWASTLHTPKDASGPSRGNFIFPHEEFTHKTHTWGHSYHKRFFSPPVPWEINLLFSSLCVTHFVWHLNGATWVTLLLCLQCIIFVILMCAPLVG